MVHEPTDQHLHRWRERLGRLTACSLVRSRLAPTPGGEHVCGASLEVVRARDGQGAAVLTGPLARQLISVRPGGVAVNRPTLTFWLSLRRPVTFSADRPYLGIV